MNIENPSYEDIIDALCVLQNACNKYMVIVEEEENDCLCDNCPLRIDYKEYSGCRLADECPAQWKIKSLKDITLLND